MPNARALIIRLRAAALALMLALAAGIAAAQPAWADMDMSSMSMGASSVSDGAAEASADVGSASSAADEDAEQLGMMPRLYRLSGSTKAATGEGGLATESVGALFPNLLSISLTPSAISTGIQCHMDEVCGYDPCTCGKPDTWGHCACGGFEETRPSVAITSSDEGVVAVVEAFGGTWLVPKGTGTATVTIHASLIHYKDADYSFNVQVAPFGILDVGLIAACIVIVAAIGTGLFFAIRALVRLAKKRAAARRFWKQRGEELKEEHPLTWKAKLESERYAKTHKGAQRKKRACRPFAHDMALALKQALPVAVAGLVLFCALVPISTTVIEDISVFNVDYTHEQLKYQLYAQNLGIFVNLACVVLGIALALALFRFLLVKRACTAYFSVGLSRLALFVSRYVAGFVSIVVAIGVPFTISLALNVAALGLYDGQLGEFAFTLCGYLTVALVSFSLASIATVCSGTLFEACAFSVALVGSATALLWGAGMLATSLLVGNAAGATLYGQSSFVAPSIMDSLSWMNPALFFADAGASHQYFMALHPVYFPQGGPWVLVAGWFVASLVLAAVAAFALCRRQGEQAEMAGKSPVLSIFAVAVFGFAVFSASVALLGTVDVAVSLVVGIVLFVLVSVIFLFGPLRGRTPRKVTLGCMGGEVAAMLAAVAIVATGAFGFAGYVPEAADVQSVEVSYNGSPSYLTEGFSGVSGGSSYYYTSYRSYTDAASVDIVRSLHRQLIDTARVTRHTDYESFESTVVPYDVVIRYTLAGGQEVVRYYSQASVGELSALTSLDNDEHSHVLETAVITGNVSGLSDQEKQDISNSPSYNAYAAGSVYLADGALNRIIAANCSDEQRNALRSALAADLASLPASERYAPSKETKAVVMFTRSPELDVSSFGYSFSNAVSYITEDWTATMAWLADNGYTDTLGTSIDPRIIESLTLQLDDPYASINKVTSPVSRYFMAYRSETAGQFWVTQDYGSLKTISDQEQIASILPNLRTGCYMTGGYLVQAKLSGIEAYVYLYLPAEYAPSDL